MEKKLLTLCIIRKESEILLGMKKRGFGEGRWNGFGGKVEEGESIEDAARRELLEESGIRAIDIEKRGILNFSFESDPKILEVHIFLIKNYEDDPVETEEMLPQWFSIENIPFEQMWTDDILWLPVFLNDKKFKGKFFFDKPSNKEYSAKILKQELEEVEELD